MRHSTTVAIDSTLSFTNPTKRIPMTDPRKTGLWVTEQSIVSGAGVIESTKRVFLNHTELHKRALAFHDSYAQFNDLLEQSATLSKKLDDLNDKAKRLLHPLQSINMKMLQRIQQEIKAYTFSKKFSSTILSILCL